MITVFPSSSLIISSSDSAEDSPSQDASSSMLRFRRSGNIKNILL